MMRLWSSASLLRFVMFNLESVKSSAQQAIGGQFRTVILGLIFSLTYVLVDRMSYIHPIGDLNITHGIRPQQSKSFFSR